MGVGEGITGMNFKNQTFADRIPDWLKIEVNPEKSDKERNTEQVIREVAIWIRSE